MGCQICGHALLAHYSWTAGSASGSACGACLAKPGDTPAKTGPEAHAFAPPKDYSVSSDGSKPVLVLTSSLSVTP